MVGAEAGAEKLEILIVDDRPENLLALEAVLGSSDYRLVRANSGDEALKYLLENEPVLILLDVQMPNMDGFETATLIKKSERLREVPIIFITAISKEEHYAQQGYAHGAVDYIFKPYDATVLRSKVSVFVDLARKNRRLLEMERTIRENDRKDRERQIAQLELKSLKREQAEQLRYRELVEGIEHGIVWSADAFSLQVNFVSPSSSKILGIPAERWITESDFLIHHIHPDDLKKFLECVRKVHDTRQPERIEHRIFNGQGLAAWMQTGLRIVRNREDTAFEIRGLSTDVTKIKMAELILQKNKVRSDLLAEASLILAESLDSEKLLTRLGKVLVPQIADIYFIDTPSEDGGSRLLAGNFPKSATLRLSQALIEKYGRDPFREIAADEVFRTGKPVFRREISPNFLRSIAKDTAHFEHLLKMGFRSVISLPLRSPEKNFGVMTLLLADSERTYDDTDYTLAEDIAHRISAALENAELYRSAREAISARDEFLSVASHELKTPLTPLKLQTQSLLKSIRKNPNALSTDKLLKMLETSDRQVTRLSTLVDDLLDVSRISIGNMSLSLEEFDLVELAKDVVERYRPQFDSQKCKLSFSAPARICVKWDRLRTEQVIINLLMNALKYGAGQPVELVVSGDESSARLSVRDNGIGIAPEAQKKIFGRFERAVTGKYYSGLGLGLYIVQEILRAHGGEIEVQSVLNEGATFTVTMPLEGVSAKTAGVEADSDEIEPSPSELATHSPRRSLNSVGDGSHASISGT